MLLLSQVIHQQFVVHLVGRHNGVGRCGKTLTSDDPKLLRGVYEKVVAINDSDKDALSMELCDRFAILDGIETKGEREPTRS